MWGYVGALEMDSIAERMFDGSEAERELAYLLANAGFEADKIGHDSYDSSVEFYRIDNEVRLTEKQQKIIWDAGFCIAYVNHKDGWETHYHHNSKPWRKRQHKKENADGNIEVEEFPDSWPKKWLESGYVKIVEKL